MAICKTNNAEIYYETYGKGKLLVLIGGFGCDHSIWTSLVEPLSQNFKVLIFDNRGSGQTNDKNQEFTLQTLAKDVIDLIDVVNEDTKLPHILGHSMGGAIAQIIAAEYPGAIDKLMLFNTSSKFNAISTLSLNNLIKLQKLNVDVDFIIENFLPWGFSNEFLADPQKVTMQKKFVKEYPYPQTLEGNQRQLSALTKFEGEGLLNKINCPTCIVGTERDLLVSPEEIQFLSRGIHNAKIIMLPGSHLMLVERPEISSKIIKDFLQT